MLAMRLRPPANAWRARQEWRKRPEGVNSQLKYADCAEGVEHGLQGGKEQLFRELWHGLDLYRRRVRLLSPT